MVFQINFTYPILGLSFSVIPLLITIYLHQKTFRNNKKIILITTLISTIIYYVGDQFAFANKIWEVSDLKSLGIRIGYDPFEQVVVTITSSMLVSLVTVIMYNCYCENKKFRNIYFQKET